jgi:hypothetical protein
VDESFHVAANCDTTALPMYSDMFLYKRNGPDEDVYVGNGGRMRSFFIVVVCLVCGACWLTGCTNVSEEELQAKIEKCTAAGMNYTYLYDFRGKPYEIMCVSKRLR